MNFRCRAYVLSPEPSGSSVSDIFERGCKCYSSGEFLNAECVIVKAWKSMVEWLKMLHACPDYSDVLEVSDDSVTISDESVC